MVRLNSHQSTRSPVRLLLTLFGIGLVATTTVPAFAGSPGTWTTTGSLNTARAVHTATLLPNGQVLVAGGQDVSGLALARIIHESGVTCEFWSER